MEKKELDIAIKHVKELGEDLMSVANAHVKLNNLEGGHVIFAAIHFLNSIASNCGLSVDEYRDVLNSAENLYEGN